MPVIDRFTAFKNTVRGRKLVLIKFPLMFKSLKLLFKRDEIENLNNIFLLKNP